MSHQIKEKDLLTILGYVTLITGLVLFHTGSKYSGLFFQGAALGCFGRSVYLRFFRRSK